MGSNVKIWIALGITVVFVLAAIWQLANMRGVRSRGRRRGAAPGGSGPSAQRRGDTRALSGAEKKLYTESQRLLSVGKISAASRILEQLGMQREAIQVLEDAGLIHDAAKILLRMQRANRAGVVYARHGMWAEAANCFKMANMPLEVAKCSREAGDLTAAAEYFEKAGRFEEAGDCQQEIGDFHKAARHFSNAGQNSKAIAMYNRLATTAENLLAIDFDEQELRHIVDYLGEGHTDEGLANVAVSRNKLTDVIRNLVSKGLVKQASELYLRATSDIGPLLMAEVSYQDRSAASLAEVFINVSAFHYAGMIFERMSAFDRAADAFEKAEDFERAAYCYERIGADQKAKLLKEKAKHSPYRGRGGSPSFALSNVTTNNDAGKTRQSFTVDSDDGTAVIDMKSGGLVPPAPRPRYAPSEERDEEVERADEPRVERRDERRDERRPEPPRPKATKFSLSDDDQDDKPERPAEVTHERAPRDLRDGAHGAGYGTPNQASATPPPRPEIPPLAAADGDVDQENSSPELPPAVNRAPVEPVRLEEGRAAFHKAKFFADLDFEQKNRIWNLGLTLDFSAEQSILTYDEVPKGVYVIIQGSVSCYKQVGGKEAYVDQMGESESFGELWLLADQPTAVRFVATKPTKIRVVGREPFNELLDKDGTIARKVYKRFALRLLKRLLRPQNSSRNQEAS